jgi:hypothetical protein
MDGFCADSTEFLLPGISISAIPGWAFYRLSESMNNSLARFAVLLQPL